MTLYDRAETVQRQPRVGQGAPAWPAGIRRHPVALAAVASVVLHLLFLSQRLGDDEGGFAMVARYAGRPGLYLYGPQWVDRPPVLILVFAVADHLGPYGVRLMATIVATVLVGAAGAAAGAVGGRTAALWAAWTAVAFSSSTLLQGERLNGELIAAAFVMVSMAALLRAGSLTAPPRTLGWWAVLAGAAAAAAEFTKQNFADGLVFGFTLFTVGLLQRRTSRALARDRRGLLVIGYLAGVLGTTGAVLLWAWSGGKVRALFYAMFGFRADAAAVMARWSPSAPFERARELGAVAVVSGVAVLVVFLLATQLPRLARWGPLAWATSAAAAVELVGIVAGGNYWTHYLLALVPTAALGAGIVAAGRSGSRSARRPAGWGVRLLACLALLVTLARLPAAYAEAHGPEGSFRMARWIAASSAPGDTIAVAFTHANLIGASGLAPVYPYSWSLPIRVLDPHLHLLVSTLDSRDAPTWFVRWSPPHLWNLDPGNRVQSALDNHYTEVAAVGGHTVWLHDARSRRLAPLRRGHGVTSPAVHRRRRPS